MQNVNLGDRETSVLHIISAGGIRHVRPVQSTGRQIFLEF